MIYNIKCDQAYQLLVNWTAMANSTFIKIKVSQMLGFTAGQGTTAVSQPD